VYFKKENRGGNIIYCKRSFLILHYMAKALLSWLVALMVPVLYAGGVYLLFNLKMLGQTSTVTVMFVSFLLGVPFGMGYLTVALSDMEQVRSKTYCGMAPWIPVFIFMGLTFIARWVDIADLSCLAAGIFHCGFSYRHPKTQVCG